MPNKSLRLKIQGRVARWRKARMDDERQELLKHTIPETRERLGAYIKSRQTGYTLRSIRWERVVIVATVILAGIVGLCKVLS